MPQLSGRSTVVFVVLTSVDISSTSTNMRVLIRDYQRNACMRHTRQCPQRTEFLDIGNVYTPESLDSVDERTIDFKHSSTSSQVISKSRRDGRCRRTEKQGKHFWFMSELLPQLTGRCRIERYPAEGYPQKPCLGYSAEVTPEQKADNSLGLDYVTKGRVKMQSQMGQPYPPS